MGAKSDPIRELERELRRALSGLPRPDVDDILEEVRSHLAEETAEGRSPTEAVASFGDPSVFAADIVTRRLRLDTESPVPPAGRGRRTASWVADFVIGWGPLVVFPIWMILISLVVDRILMGPADVAYLENTYGYQQMGLPWWAVVGTLAAVTWGVFYWLALRRRSVSIGMRMAGLSRLSVAEKTAMVKTADLADSTPARIVARPKWYLVAPIGALGVIVAFAAFYYVTFAAGSFLQPWDSVRQSVDSYTDLTRAEPVLKSFYDKVLEGDVAGAQELATPEAAPDVAALAARAEADDVARVDLGQSVDENVWEMREYIPNRPTRTVVLTLVREESQESSSTYVTTYKVAKIQR